MKYIKAENLAKAFSETDSKLLCEIARDSEKMSNIADAMKMFATIEYDVVVTKNDVREWLGCSQSCSFNEYIFCSSNYDDVEWDEIRNELIFSSLNIEDEEISSAIKKEENRIIHSLLENEAFDEISGNIQFEKGDLLCVNLVLSGLDGGEEDIVHDICRWACGETETLPECCGNTAFAAFIKSQGYDFDDIRNAKAGDKGFLPTFKAEMEEALSSGGEITLLCQMTVEDIEKILFSKSTIHLSRRAFAGIFDRVSGAGGTMEVELEKDVDIPSSLLGVLQVESPGARLDQNGGYMLDYVYGMAEKVWNTRAEIIQEQPWVSCSPA